MTPGFIIPMELIVLVVAIVAIGVVAAGVASLVLRYGQVKEDKGGASEKVDALEGAIVEADEREKAARNQRGMSHAEWKKAGAKRRKKRARSGGRS